MIPDNRPQNSRGENRIEHHQNGVSQVMSEGVIANVRQAWRGQQIRDEDRNPRQHKIRNEQFGR